MFDGSILSKQLVMYMATCSRGSTVALLIYTWDVLKIKPKILPSYQIVFNSFMFAKDDSEIPFL